MKKLLKVLTIWLILGAIYYIIEGLYHLPSGGYANILMLPIGGLCGLCVGSINQVKAFYNMKIVWQCLIGTVLTTLIEFISGMILNVALGLNIWDYSNLLFNVKGQISLIFSLIWFLLMPLGIWAEDMIRYRLWHEGNYYSLLSVYKDLITYK